MTLYMTLGPTLYTLGPHPPSPSTSRGRHSTSQDPRNSYLATLNGTGMNMATSGSLTCGCLI